MRVSDYIGQTAYDRDGRKLGRIADLICHRPDGGEPIVDAALISPRYRGRMFGYERESMRGPWLLEKIITWLHRGTHEVALNDIVVTPRR